jgi:hypothetical protein
MVSSSQQSFSVAVDVNEMVSGKLTVNGPTLQQPLAAEL